MEGNNSESIQEPIIAENNTPSDKDDPLASSLKKDRELSNISQSSGKNDSPSYSSEGEAEEGQDEQVTLNPNITLVNFNEDDIEFNTKITEPNINVLCQRYDLLTYDFENCGQAYFKQMQSQSLEFPSKELPTLYKLYLEAVKHIFNILLLVCSVQSCVIYLVAIFGSNKKFLNLLLSHDFYSLVMTPYPYVYSSQYYEIVDHLLKPVILIIFCIALTKALADLENSIVHELKKTGRKNMFCCIKLDKVRYTNLEDLANDVDKLVGKVVEKDLIPLVNGDCIEEKISEYFKLRVDARVLETKAKLEDPGSKLNSDVLEKFEDLTQKAEKVKSEIKIIKNRILEKAQSTDPKMERSCLILFHSYEDSMMFRSNLGSMRAKLSLNRKLSKNLKIRSLSRSKFQYAPDPSNINWDHYLEPKDEQKKCVIRTSLIIGFFIISPCLTFFAEYSLSQILARGLMSVLKNPKIGADKIVKYTYAYMLSRVLASSGYATICTYIINYYYDTYRNFSTHSGKESSKFLFYNVYFLLNQIIADFYGIIRAGIVEIDLKSLKSEDILLDYGYSSFIFGAALKVCLMLCLTPYIVKLIDFLPKIWRIIRKNYKKRLGLNWDKVKVELPIQHDFVVAGSFAVQCVFFASFFAAFMMPFLNLIFLIGLYSFYHFERHMLNKHLSRRKGFSFRQIKMMYQTCFVGFLLIQPLSFGNVHLVLSYFNNMSIKSLTSILISGTDYVVFGLFCLFAAVVIFNSRESAIQLRIHKKLMALEMRGQLQDSGSGNALSGYEVKNPVFKAKSGIYDIQF